MSETVLFLPVLFPAFSETLSFTITAKSRCANNPRGFGNISSSFQMYR
jgi:hypothetical protein